jgi:hypothetical protein
MPEQITRLLLFFLLVLIGYFVVRPALIPPTYGLYGQYRAASLIELQARESAHVGLAQCVSRHEDEGHELAGSQHASVRCESCHGPGAGHVADPAAVRMTVPPHEEMRQFCGLCHHDRIARPRWMPQVDLATHYTPDACVDCHSPHATEDW